MRQRASNNPNNGMVAQTATARRIGRVIRSALMLASLALPTSAASAAPTTSTASSASPTPFHIEDVASITARPIDHIPAGTILFADHSEGEAADPQTGLISFKNWGRTRPDQQQLLDLYPGYTEPVVKHTVVGVTRSRTEKLTMYVASARFKLHWVPSVAEIARFASLAFVRHIDPKIEHRLIAPDRITPLTNAKFAYNLNPLRAWCVGAAMICLHSHYRLEGKLPLAVHLANKLREASRKIADYIDFESELAARSPDDLDLPAVVRLTSLDAPVIGTLEQTTFYVNQVLQFAKFLVVFQNDPSNPQVTVATAFMALAIDSKVLGIKKSYARIPVLRNLVPIQVLMGQSSFNVGTSISSGLPNYARSRIKAVARILNAG